MKAVLIDHLGQRFGRLTVTQRAENGYGKKAQWLCVCDCGASLVVASGNLRSGNTRSCGCLRREEVSARRKKHGLSQTSEYYSTRAAFHRCTSPRDLHYRDYGGRGIEYRLPTDPGEATLAVIEAIGHRPPGLSLDRIDNNGHYEIGNLRWATCVEQVANQRPRVRNGGGL